MSRGIIDLIEKNKRRFYAGEIRNYFYDEPYSERKNRQRTIIIDSEIDEVEETDTSSLWQNLKSFGQRFSDDLFYEPAK